MNFAKRKTEEIIEVFNLELKKKLTQKLISRLFKYEFELESRRGGTFIKTINTRRVYEG